jgi:hypothetical protein
MRERTASRWLSAIAWGIVALLGTFSLVSVASVGLALAPVAVLLAIALHRL